MPFANLTPSVDPTPERKDNKMTSTEEMVAKHPFWNDMAPRYSELLAGHSTIQSFEAGQEIFQEGKEADRFFLVEKGQIKLHTFVPPRGDVTIQTVSAGAALGWSWLFPPYQWHFSAHANEPTILIALDAKYLRRLCEAHADFGFELIKRVSRVLFQRLQETRLLLVDFYGDTR